MTAAVEAGRADVGLTADPFAMMARATNTILPDNFFSALALPVLITCFVATEQWLDANADRARKFATAIRRAAVWANGHQAETHPLLARITNMDPKLIPGMAPTVFGTSLEPAQIAPVVDAMLKYGLIDKRVDPKEMIWQ
jgi:ABC-type nitrate/sulfonate/bicarbonate transport system substrate-binding protein